MFIFPIALFTLSRTVSGIYLALGKYLFTQLMTYIFPERFLDALYPSCLTERNCLVTMWLGFTSPNMLLYVHLEAI